MKTVLEYIDQNKRQLSDHPLFVRLRDTGIEPLQRQLALVGMAAMLAKLIEVVECDSSTDAVRLRLLSHRLVRLVWLARDAVRPTVLLAMQQSCELLWAYLSKLCKCSAVDPGPALQTLARWELVRERLRSAGGAETTAVTVLDEDMRRQAQNLIDAVFELVEGGCDELLFSCAPTDDAIWAALPASRSSGADSSS